MRSLNDLPDVGDPFDAGRGARLVVMSDDDNAYVNTEKPGAVDAIYHAISRGTGRPRHGRRRDQDCPRLRELNRRRLRRGGRGVNGPTRCIISLARWQPTRYCRWFRTSEPFAGWPGSRARVMQSRGTWTKLGPGTGRCSLEPPCRQAWRTHRAAYRGRDFPGFRTADRPLG